MILPRIQSVMSRYRYVVYTEPYRLNIVGLRSKNTRSNRFDDEIHVFYRTTGDKWNYHVFQATTDPGTFWLNNPSSPQGTAILAQGQYVNCYVLGLHHGEYTALVQVAPVSIIRDYNRNSTLDFNNGQIARGNYGINIHRASQTGTTKFIDSYSAGCQVFANAGDFSQFINLCREHERRYGNHFTYTLIDYRAMRRETYKRVALAGTLASALSLSYLMYKQAA